MHQIAITVISGRAQPSMHGVYGFLSYFYSTVVELTLEGSYSGRLSDVHKAGQAKCVSKPF